MRSRSAPTRPPPIRWSSSRCCPAYDRGEKLDRYESIPSLRHVVLIETDAVEVEVWSRGEGGWTRSVFVRLEDGVPLAALGIELPVSELYEGLDRLPR
ncbi:MAG: hypothetical protein ABMB14_08845 [Myxococcota bacterium]